MNKILIAVFALYVTARLFAKSKKIVFSGAVKNHTATSIMIPRLNNQKVMPSELGDNGTFSMTFKV